MKRIINTPVEKLLDWPNGADLQPPKQQAQAKAEHDTKHIHGNGSPIDRTADSS
jgi:hypothetical protein